MAQCFERFQNTVWVTEQTGGFFGFKPLVATETGHDVATKATVQMAAMLAGTSKERTLAIAFLMGSNPDKCGSMIQSFKNAFTVDRDKWPTQAHSTLNNWKRDTGGQVRTGTKGVLSFEDESQAAPSC